MTPITHNDFDGPRPAQPTMARFAGPTTWMATRPKVEFEMIPRKIHYVWVGGPLPESKARLIAGWRDQNPNYELVRWSEDNIDFSIPMLRHAYQEKRWSKVADIVRLMAVHAQGGILSRHRFPDPQAAQLAFGQCRVLVVPGR